VAFNGAYSWMEMQSHNSLPTLVALEKCYGLEKIGKKTGSYKSV